MQIQVQTDDAVVVYALNACRAAQELYAQLPLTLEVENFSTNEKIFYPPNALSTEGAPLAQPQKGTLAYYAPWGDVVLFYAPAGQGNGLYALGEVVSGENEIEALTGAIEITALH